MGCLCVNSLTWNAATAVLIGRFPESRGVKTNPITAFKVVKNLTSHTIATTKKENKIPDG